MHTSAFSKIYDNFELNSINKYYFYSSIHNSFVSYFKELNFIPLYFKKVQKGIYFESDKILITGLNAYKNIQIEKIIPY